MATYYISTAGNDTTGDGSSALPWLTISKAHTSASSGDTIIVKTSASTYTFSNQTFTKTLIIQGETTNQLNHVFSGTGIAVGWQLSGTGIGLTVSNLKFTNAIAAICFYAPSTSGYLSFTSCTFDLLASAAGSWLFYGSGQVVNITLTRCLVYNLAAVSGTPVRYLYFGTTNNIFNMTNNTFYLPAITSLMNCNASTVTGTLKNNIFNCIGSTPYFSGNNPTTAATYNDFFQITSAPSGTGNITSDPLFIDATTNNFNLRPTSPCIDAGSNV